MVDCALFSRAIRPVSLLVSIIVHFPHPLSILLHPRRPKGCPVDTAAHSRIRDPCCSVRVSRKTDRAQTQTRLSGRAPRGCWHVIVLIGPTTADVTVWTASRRSRFPCSTPLGTGGWKTCRWASPIPVCRRARKSVLKTFGTRNPRGRRWHQTRTRGYCT